jgi:hypothetical protein
MHDYRLRLISVHTTHSISVISAAVAIPSFSGIKFPPRVRLRARVKYVTRGPTRA